MLHELVTDTRGRPEVVMAIDFNAWVLDWDSRTYAPREHSLLKPFARLEVTLLNDDDRNTRLQGLGGC